MCKKISRQEAVLALKKLFDYEGHKESKQVIVVEHDDKTTFMIDKRYLERYEVIHKLKKIVGNAFGRETLMQWLVSC